MKNDPQVYLKIEIMVYDLIEVKKFNYSIMIPT